MTTVLLLFITGLGLGALYFMVAAGLSLIFGLMRILNVAQGAFMTLGMYAGWQVSQWIPVGSDWLEWFITVVAAMLAGALFAILVEVFLIRPLYKRPIDQILITVGVMFAVVALIQGSYGTDPKPFTIPQWMSDTTTVLGARIPDTRFVVIGIAALFFALLFVFLKYTRYGLIVRAGVENRSMVEALGINVQRAFTLVFAIGGLASGLAGIMAATYLGSIDTTSGTAFLIFGLIVIVIGGFGSITGTAVAAVAVGLMQQFLNYYASGGVGDFSTVLLLAIVLLMRPRRQWDATP